MPIEFIQTFFNPVYFQTLIKFANFGVSNYSL
jgi:hypothetical protein